MAWTGPTTRVAAEVIDASDWNTDLTDNIAWLGTDAPCCRIKDSGTFSHNSSGNYLAVTHNQEDFDNAAMHDTSSNTDRMTIPAGGGGKYLLGGGVTWDANATGVRAVTHHKGGAAGTIVGAQNGLPSVPATGFAQSPGAALVSLAAGEYVSLTAFQSSGATRTITPIHAFAIWQRT